jgi:hypothetical protein
MKYLLIALIALSVPLSAQSGLTITTSPEFKVGKMENGNFFMEATPLRQTYAFGNNFRTKIKASVGFTAPRESKSAMNHYMNSFLVRSEIVLGMVVMFAEFNWGSIIEGAANEASYFDGTYQAIGVSLEL